MKIEKFQYITPDIQDNDRLVYIVENVLQGGCKWIQYRSKHVSKISDYLDTAIKLKHLCKKHHSTFIINDYVEIADELGTDGVHLGLNDMPIKEARKILGSQKIIGATANTFEEVEHQIEVGANYIGLGPYQFTETKKNLSPELGIKGYWEILNRLSLSNNRIPIIAIGGIHARNVPELLDTGIFGVAISSYISRSDDIKSVTRKTIRMLQRTNQFV